MLATPNKPLVIFVMLDASKVATSVLASGTVAGVQFVETGQLLLPGTAFQVALPAWAL